MNTKTSRRSTVALYLITHFLREKERDRARKKSYKHTQKLSDTTFLPHLPWNFQRSSLLTGFPSPVICHPRDHSVNPSDKVYEFGILTLKSLCLTRWSFATPNS